MVRSPEDPAPLNDDGTYALAPQSEPPAAPEAPVPSQQAEHDTRPDPATERCARCGYELTGLALTTACPECGSTERRTDTARRPVANAGWLTTLARGIAIAWAAIAIACLTSLAQLAFGHSAPTPRLGGLSIDHTLMAFSKLLGAVALFILTQPNPALLGPGTSPTDHAAGPSSDPHTHSHLWPAPPRLIARYGAAAFGIIHLLTIAAAITLPNGLESLTIAAAIVALPTLFAGLTYTADLFEQLGQRQQAFETRIVRFGWPATLIATLAWYLLRASQPTTSTTTTALAVVLVLLIVVLLFWSLALLIHLGQSVHHPLQNAD